jgi:hypothetical protein
MRVPNGHFRAQLWRKMLYAAVLSPAGSRLSDSLRSVIILEAQEQDYAT